MAVLTAGVTAYVATRTSTKHAARSTAAANPPRLPSSAPTPNQQAEAWIRANLPRTTRVGTDATLARDLVRAGFSTARSYVSVGTEAAGSYLVTTPQIRDDVTTGLAEAAARISPLLVASFGTGPGRVELVLLVAGGAAGLLARLADETSERETADHGLVANPRVALDAAARPWLVAGRLDLRAATVVALLAARTEVHLSAITLDPAEAAIGRPARTLTLSASDAAALTDVLRALPDYYAPAHTSTLPDGARRLTWPVGLAPEGL